MAKQDDHIAGLAIQIPDEMLRAAILDLVAKALPDRDKLIQQVVREAMLEPPDRYARRGETKFGKIIADEIRALCEVVFREWLDGKKDAIRDQLLRELEKIKAKRLRAIVEALADGLSTLSVSGIRLRIEEE